jgi:hypothetical protein
MNDEQAKWRVEWRVLHLLNDDGNQSVNLILFSDAGELVGEGMR